MAKKKAKKKNKVPVAIVEDMAAEQVIPASRPTQVVLTNRQKKKRVFLGDSIRDENDTAFINKERRKREYKGRIIRITTVKEYEVSADGFLETEFVIELK